MTTTRFLLSIGLAASLAGCYWTVSKQNPEDTFCRALSEVHLRIAELRDLSPSKTATDLRIVERTLWYDMEALRRSAAQSMDAPDIRPLTDAVDHLDRVVSAIPETASLDEARAAIAEPLREVGDARAQLESASRCPVPSAVRP